MSIIAIANQKGGVGKTTLTVHLACWLSRQGRSVIIVDADPQGNVTAWARDGDVSVDGFWRLLIGRDPLPAIVRPSKWKGVDILPGNAATGEAMIVLATLRRPFDSVAAALGPLDAMADYIFLDMPPSRAAGFHETLFAADYLLVPTQPERLSLQGVSLMADTVKLLSSEFGHAPALLGVIPNMVRKNTLEHQENLRELVQNFGQLVWPPVALTVRLSEASAYGATLFDLEPDHAVTHTLTEIGQRILSNLEA